MKLSAILGGAVLLTPTLTGCVVVPAEPVVYHGHGRYYRRGWR